jgi:hypothetical protein
VQRDEFFLVDILRHHRPRVTAGPGLRLGRAEREATNEHTDRERENSDLARHEGSIRTGRIGPRRRPGTKNRPKVMHD